MTMDLDIGFTDKPESLDEILIRLGFENCGTSNSEVSSLKITEYAYYEDGWDGFIQLDYVDGIYEPEIWGSIHPDGKKMVAEIKMHTAFIAEIWEKAVTFGKILRDHYGAILYDGFNVIED